MFLENPRRLFVDAHRPRAAQLLIDAFLRRAPFLIQAADGGFEFGPDPFLVLLVTQLGLFRRRVQQPPRLRQVAGDGFRQRRRAAHSEEINRQQNQHHAGDHARARRRHDHFHLQMIHHQHRHAGQQNQRHQPGGNEPENLRQRKFFELLQVGAGFLLQFLLLLEQLVFVRRQIRLRPFVTAAKAAAGICRSRRTPSARISSVPPARRRFPPWRAGNVRASRRYWPARRRGGVRLPACSPGFCISTGRAARRFRPSTVCGRRHGRC